MGRTTEIKFNRNYTKLHGQTEARLLHVETHLGRALDPEFIKYDTDGKYTFEYSHRYICLYLVGNKGIPFSTLRKFNKTNVLKYFGQKGKLFKIVVEEEEPLPNHWVPM